MAVSSVWPSSLKSSILATVSLMIYVSSFLELAQEKRESITFFLSVGASGTNSRNRFPG